MLLNLIAFTVLTCLTCDFSSFCWLQKVIVALSTGYSGCIYKYLKDNFVNVFEILNI